MRVFPLLAVLLGLLGGVAPQVADIGDEPVTLAESNFLWDTDGWTVSLPGLELVHGNKMVKAADEGGEEWYFEAPSKFLGAKRTAYGGQLSFRHGFFEYDSAGEDMKGGFDVVLSSEQHGITVGLRHVIPAWQFKSDHSLDLVESAGWVLESTGGPPSRPDMQRLLSSLSSLRVRGGFYAGHEECYLMGVRLVAGPPDTAPKKSSLRAQHVIAGGKSTVVTDTKPFQPAPSDDPPPPPPHDGEL